MEIVGLAAISVTLLKGLVFETLENSRKVTLLLMFRTWNLKSEATGLVSAETMKLRLVEIPSGEICSNTIPETIHGKAISSTLDFETCALPLERLLMAGHSGPCFPHETIRLGGRRGAHVMEALPVVRYAGELAAH